MNTPKIISLLSSLTFSSGSQDEIKYLYNSYLGLKAPSEQYCFLIKDAPGALVAGTFGSLTQNHSLHVESVFVLPEHRRQGYGSIVLGRLEQEALRKGASSVNLQTYDPAAKAFILRNHYEVVAEMEDAPIKQQKLTYFKKVLSLPREEVVLPAGWQLVAGAAEDVAAIGGLHWKYHFSTSPRFTSEVPHKTLSVVAKDAAGKVVGGIVGNINLSDTLFLHAAFVDEAWRRKGLGSHLLGQLEERARDAGAYLSFAKEYLPEAKPFLLSNGYEIIGSIEDTPVQGSVMSYFKKELSGPDYKIVPATDEEQGKTMEAHIAWWLSQLPDPTVYPWEMLCFVQKDAIGEIIAGVSGGTTLGNTLSIGNLFVAEEFRDKGYEVALLETIEQAAVAKGCYLALCLPGMNFISADEAKVFESAGYTSAVSPGQSQDLYFLQKPLLARPQNHKLDSFFPGTAEDAGLLAAASPKHEKIAFAAKSDEGELLGCVSGAVIGSSLFPIDLYVFEKRKGVGSSLLKRLERAAVLAGAETVLFYTPNHSSALFYQKNGYELLATIDNATFSGNRLYILKKDL